MRGALDGGRQCGSLTGDLPLTAHRGGGNGRVGGVRVKPVLARLGIRFGFGIGFG
ncbi:hypothetical protein IOD14_23520 [Streptomyces sp. A2-16]|uniref:hypothetical protein n=1 Tax=Streptomyces sp. A2-16 TaxID=2781734 RepID=UPI001BB072AC|nr:hypothetical protein [Streptomyces sp. A2-16]QUC59478.1 hypothetical protein IOD14_23520 [Streptomyces sp. A2-16]